MSAETGQAEFVKATEYFQAAADKGSVIGKYALGECYLEGRGVRKDQRRGVEFLRAAAVSGDTSAMNLLGNCYTHGTGVKQDFAQAFQLFTDASEGGNLQALGNLGVLYMTGRGVPEPNPSKGAELFQRGARAGESVSMFNFTQCLEGGLGVAKNEVQAQVWYRKAAEAGEPRAANWCKTHNVPFTQG